MRRKNDPGIEAFVEIAPICRDNDCRQEYSIPKLEEHTYSSRKTIDTQLADSP